MSTLVCIASGPSLTAADCELVRLSGLETLAVNNSWKLAPFCHHLYAGDAKWWDAYGQEVNIPAKRWTCSQRAAKKHGLNFHRARGPYNSGMRAVQWGIEQGKKNIVLLGYDCQVKNGTHWHGDHEETRNPDVDRCRKWQKQLAQVGIIAKALGVEIINCSRDTALTCFEMQTLENVLDV